MKLITQRDLIRAVADRWHKQYAPFPPEAPLFSARTGLRAPFPKLPIYEKLVALDKEAATADQVNSIIGNDSWTSIACDGCKEKVDAVACVGKGDDSFYLCKSCSQRALELLK